MQKTIHTGCDFRTGIKVGNRVSAKLQIEHQIQSGHGCIRFQRQRRVFGCGMIDPCKPVREKIHIMVSCAGDLNFIGDIDGVFLRLSFGNQRNDKQYRQNAAEPSSHDLHLPFIGCIIANDSMGVKNFL